MTASSRERIHPPLEEWPWKVSGAALQRPLLLLAFLYAIAIAFERIVDIEVYKPYRVVGVILVFGALFLVKIKFDKVGKLTAVFLIIGLVIGVMGYGNPDGRDDMFVNSALIWVFNFATYVAVLSVARSRGELALLAIAHAVAILLAARGIAIDAAETEGLSRAFGDFKNPANATVSMLFACLVLISALRSPAAERRLTKTVAQSLCVAVVAFLFYAVTLTGSRTGAVLFAVGLLSYGILCLRHRVALALMGIGVAATLFVSAPAINNFVEELSHQSILVKRVESKGFDTARLYLWRAGFDALSDTYGIGTGMARYAEVHKEYFASYARLSDESWLDTDLTLHNDYVVAIVEHGVLGFLVFLLLCRELFLTARGIRNSQVRAIALSVLLGMLINGFSHNGVTHFSYWFYFALLVGWGLHERRLMAKSTLVRRQRHGRTA